MSDVHYYRDLLTHRGRVDAFRRAVKAVVRKGDRVLDVGAGLGTFSFFAAQAGAARVWAVDGDPIILVGKAIAAANGYADRVEFIRGCIPDVRLQERADVMIFEDFSSELLDTETFHLLRSMHQHYAADPVRTIPARARVFMAPVRDAAAYEDVSSFRLEEGERLFGIDWSASRSYALNTPRRTRLGKEAIVTDPAAIGDLWLNLPPDSSVLDGEASWRMPSAGPVHGVALWFDLEMAPGEWISNAPGAPEATWRQVFLPLDPPLTTGAGQLLRATVRRERHPDESPGWLSWTVESEGVSARGHEFASRPAALKDLFPLSSDTVPVLDPKAAREATVLGLTDGRRSVEQIAEGLLEVYPDLSRTQALQLVTETLLGRA